MPKINALIEERLRQYPADVIELATKAIMLSEQLDEADVVQNLHQVARQIARQRETVRLEEER